MTDAYRYGLTGPRYLCRWRDRCSSFPRILYAEPGPGIFFVVAYYSLQLAIHFSL